MSELNASAGNGFGNILDIAKLLGPMMFGSGKTNTSDVTTTTKSVDAESMNMNKQLFAALGLDASDAEGTTASIVDRIIEKAAIAFAPVAGMQNQAGMYNSSVLAQLSGQASAAASKDAASAVLDYKTNTQKLQAVVGGNLLANGPTTSTAAKTGTLQLAPAVKPGISAALTAAMIARSASAMMDEKLKKAPLPRPSGANADIPEVYENVDTAASMTGSTSTATTGTESATFGGEGAAEVGANVGDIISASQFGADTLSASQAGVSAYSAPLVDGAVDVAGSLGGAEIAGTAAEDLTGAFALGTAEDAAIGAGVGGFATDEALLGAGTAFGEASGAVAGAELAGGAAAIEGGAAAATFVEGAAAAEGIGEAAAAIALWVICTELVAQGKMPRRLYEAGWTHTANLPPTVIAGYHWWAIPYTRWMRRSKFGSALITPLALARASYIAGEGWNFWGWLSVAAGEPLCGLIGRCLTATVGSRWQELYTKECS